METASQQSTLTALPLEVRYKILGYLLPDLPEIQVFDGYHDYVPLRHVLKTEIWGI